jgi:hypothetical protein
MRKLRQPKNTDIVLRVPAWATKVYIMLAAVLLPWTIYISLTLPHDHLTGHWNASWTGLDIGLIVSLLATGIFAYFRSIWVVIAAASTGSLLLADAWLDVMGEKLSHDFHRALILAFVFELPLASLSYYLASHALRHNSGRRHHRSRKRSR